MKPDNPIVIYEDEYLVGLNKPAGLIVNRSDTTKDVPVLQDWVEEHIQPALSIKNPENSSDFYARSGIVHRLDKETSGVILISKNEDTFSKLQALFKQREIRKVYTALVHGKIIPEENSIEVPVGRIPWDRKRFGVVVDGKPASTYYRTIGQYYLKDGKKQFMYSLIEAYPRTGRTHQIRVHMRYAGFPIAGDVLYAGRKNYQRDKKYLQRHFLHASKLIFTHPVTHEDIVLNSPLPEELQSFLDVLVPAV